MKHLKDFDDFDWSKLKEHEFPFQEDAWKDMEHRINSTQSPFNFLRNIQIFLGLTSLFYFFVIILLLFTVFSNDKKKTASSSNLNEPSAEYLWPAFLKNINTSNSPENTFQNTALWGLTQQGNFFTNDNPILLSDNIRVNSIKTQSSSKLQERFENYQQLSTPDRVYVHTDRPLYSPGDDIWFKAYVRDAASFKASTLSDVVYVDLINPAGGKVYQRRLLAIDGHVKGDFRLPDNIPGGTYTLKAYTNWQRNFKDYFEKTIYVQKSVIPKLAMQLDFDKKAYANGDVVKATLDINGTDNESFALQYTLSIAGEEVLDEKATTNTDGTAELKFKLPKSLNSTDGLLNVLIDYKGDKESIARSIPIVLNDIDVQFFPEGGELIAGVPSRIAFKAVNEFGKPASVEGAIYDKNGKKATSFSSIHNGMGTVEFTPKVGEQYTAKITKPAINETFALPRAQKEGYTIIVTDQKPSSIEVGIVSTNPRQLTLIAQSRGKIWLEENITVEEGISPVKIATSKMPVGIVQLTLLDENEVELAERLVFANKHKRLKVAINTDKKQYLPREKVKMTISVKDENNKPVAGNFSLSVVDDKLLSYADDKQSNILAYMLLQSDLKGKITEPNFYFEKNNAGTDEALDLLLMTQGWRKFEWQKINTNPEVVLQYNNETAIVAGIINDDEGNPVRNAQLKLSNSSTRKRTNEDGYFEFKNVDLSRNTWLRISKDGYPVNWAKIAQYHSNLKFRISKSTAIAYDLSPYAGNFKPYSSDYLEVVPTRYETVTEQIETAPASSRLVAIPPEFETTEEKVLIQEATDTQEAVYETIKKQILKNPATYREEGIPATYEAITKKVIASPATTRSREYQIAAEYRTMTKRVFQPEQVIKKDNGETKVIPASYKTVVEQIPLKDGTGNTSPVPDGGSMPYTYEWATNDNPGFAVKTKSFDGQQPITEALDTDDSTTYKIYYLKQKQKAQTKEVKKPAKYVTKTRKVMKEAPKTKKVEVAAQYMTVQVREKDKDGNFQSVSKKIEISPKHFIYEVAQAEYEESEEKFKISGSYDILEIVPATYEVASRYKKRNVLKGLEVNGFYRARSYYAPKYDKPKKSKERSDFRPTIYWNTNVNVGESGSKTLEFYNSDAMTTFRASLEGFANTGQIGCSTHKFSTTMPLSMDIKTPANVIQGDKIAIPLTITNNSKEDISGVLSISAPKNFKLLEPVDSARKIEAGKAETILLEYEATHTGTGKFSISFDGQQFKDQFSAEINAYKRGFPVKAVLSGNQADNNFNINIKEPTENTSVQAIFTIYPDMLSEMMTGLDRILKQPRGCFEQVSSSNYPNIMVLDYLLENGKTDDVIEQKANNYLAEGYQKLIAYEVEGGGFDWYGRAPAHEGLTAYGLMQFKDMKSVYPVDQQVVKRTAEWLLSKKDGNGSWNINEKHLYNWTNPAVIHTYINWALSEAGYGSKIDDEITKSYEEAISSGDAYMLALLSNTLLANADKRYLEVNEQLLKVAQANGSFKGKFHSIVHSTGDNLQIEATALTITALVGAIADAKNKKEYEAAIQKGISFLLSSKTPGGFGNTQGTVLTLRALQKYSTYQSQKISGKVSLLINGKTVHSKDYSKGLNSNHIVENIGKYLKTGQQQIQVQFEGTPLPFDLFIDYTTDTPNNDNKTPVQLDVNWSQSNVNIGETVRLTAKLSNKTDKSLASPVALVGIPAGLSLPPKQLEKLLDQQQADYYELWNGYLVLHYRKLEKGEQKTVQLDLKADIRGNYESAASKAYLYYDNNTQFWTTPSRIQIEG